MMGGVISYKKTVFGAIVLLLMFGFTTSRSHGGTVRYWDEC